MDKISGIYKITSITKPDRMYVGSTIDMKKRWGAHLNDLKNNKHRNKKLQRHYNKYGKDDLIFSIIISCDKSELKPINGIVRPEQFFIWAYNPYFNICTWAGSSVGVKRTAKQIERNRETHIGAKNVRYGAKLTPEHIQILIDSNKNRGVSEETKEKIRIARKGTKASAETKKKMSIKRKGKLTPMAGMIPWNKGKTNIYSEETIQKIRDARAKQVFSEESQKKKSETMKRIWENRRLKVTQNED